MNFNDSCNAQSTQFVFERLKTRERVPSRAPVETNPLELPPVSIDDIEFQNVVEHPIKSLDWGTWMVIVNNLMFNGKKEDGVGGFVEGSLSDPKGKLIPIVRIVNSDYTAEIKLNPNES